ncbi:MAG: AmmeMemoRadiSam system protein B [Treponema sp.]|jgi:AmmeMemoRadiSam system protein B|nr:AmmeMemoRadiSam system protein B [Treponema sp.]
MTIHEPVLPAGWYPRDAAGITRFLEPFKAGAASPGATASGIAAMSPHAGWYYSGAVSAAAFAALDKSADTIVILGGHLAARSPVLLVTEDAYRSPLGLMDIDGELRAALCTAFGKTGHPWAADRYRDNTVEVLVPLAHYFFPRSRLLALRLPADSSSFQTGQSLADAAKALGRKIVVIASTDLTHYGPNYGFSPQGQGARALAWMREVNDRRFIDAVLEGNPETVLLRAEEESSACSAGAVLGALGFACAFSGDAARRSGAELLAYGTSADVAEDPHGGDIPDSFVGYAAITWR